MDSVDSVPPELLKALRAQRERWYAALARGARRVGWKFGRGDRERISGEQPIGYLTSATQLEADAIYPARETAQLFLDAEIAIQLCRPVAPDADESVCAASIGSFAPAIELVDLAGTDDAEAIVATNLWHRAFVLGRPHTSMPTDGVDVAVQIGGEQREHARSANNFADTVHVVARLLGALGERAEAGDWIITGNIVQIPVSPGDRAVADFGALGHVSLAVV